MRSLKILAVAAATFVTLALTGCDSQGPNPAGTSSRQTALKSEVQSAPILSISSPMPGPRRQLERMFDLSPNVIQDSYMPLRGIMYYSTTRDLNGSEDITQILGAHGAAFIFPDEKIERSFNIVAIHYEDKPMVLDQERTSKGRYVLSFRTNEGHDVERFVPAEYLDDVDQRDNLAAIIQEISRKVVRDYPLFYKYWQSSFVIHNEKTHEADVAATEKFIHDEWDAPRSKAVTFCREHQLKWDEGLWMADQHTAIKNLLGSVREWREPSETEQARQLASLEAINAYFATPGHPVPPKKQGA